MRLERVASDNSLQVSLSWSRPALYDKARTLGLSHDEDGWLYMILGYYRSTKPKIFYIGKVFNNITSKRLRQADHRQRYSTLTEKFPRHSFKVTVASVELTGGKIIERRIDQIETLLIYTAKRSNPHLSNKRKLLTHRVASPYTISNHGYRHPLPREINLDVYIRR